MEREVFALDQGWSFFRGDVSILPAENTHDKVYGFAKAGGMGGPASHAFDHRTWETVNLPHDSLLQMPFDEAQAPNHNYKKRGVCWYRIQFRLEPEDLEKNLTLLFDGISGVSDVYCNGSWAGGSKSGYSSFAVDITELAVFGSALNVLAVRCDNTQWEGWWYEGGGMYRHVYLYKKSAVHIKPWGIWAKVEKIERGWQVPVEVELGNAFGITEKYLLTAALFYQGKEVASQECSGSLGGYEELTRRLLLEVETPTLWQLDNPALYQVSVEVKTESGADRAEENIGFRTVRIDVDTGFYLNGDSVKLKGVCNHLDHGPLGVAVPVAIHRYRLQILKDMGCNAYRCAHNPPPPELLCLCDEMGILVIDENRNFSTSSTHTALLKDLVKRDRNHPSVIMYSIFNEEPLQGTIRGRRLASKMMAEIKRMDDTRPVIGCFNGGYLETEGAATVFDATGINYFIDSYDVFHKKFPQQPVVAAELVSAFATRGVYQTDSEKQVFDNYDSEKAPWGQSVQEAWQAVSSRDFIMGQFIWTGFDYKGEPTPYRWPSVSSHFGVVDTCGFPKDTYHLYRAYWTKEPVLHLLPHWDFPEQAGMITVMTYTNCEEVELFLNGESQGRQVVDYFSQPSWQVDYQRGNIEAVGFAKGAEIVRQKRATTGTAHSIRVERERDWVYRDNRDALPLNISLEDAEGRTLCTAENQVSVQVIGGALLGMGNGNPNSHELDVADTRTLFSGYCQAIVQGGADDQIKVTVGAMGVPETIFFLEVKDRACLPQLVPVAERMLTGWRVSHHPMSTRPDPKMELDSTDMNTFEPIAFNGKPQQSLEGQKGAYLVFYNQVEILGGETTVVFSDLLGEGEVFCNGELLHQEATSKAGQLQVGLPRSLQGQQTLVVFVKNTSGGLAGILENVFIH